MTELMVLLLTFLAGVGLPLQAIINARLGGVLGVPLGATLVNFGVGTLVIAGVLLAMQARPSFSTAIQGPWWLWVGGFFGVFVVTMSLIAAPRVGAATMVALLVTGQLIGSLLLDHYGVLGLPEQNIDWKRVLGALMLLGGMVLIRGWR